MTHLPPPDESAKRAARRALADGFEAVRKHLLLTFTDPTEAERIHKLRVAVRRATAAVDAFAPCLRRRAVREARRTLRTVRRTAGAARDWDVFIPSVITWADTQPDTVRPFADALLGWSAAHQQAAHAVLVGLADDYPAALDRVRDDTLAALRKPTDGATTRDLGRMRVAELCDQLTAACDREPTTADQFHRVRILGKRLRYAVELFAEHLPDAEKLDADMRALQDALGRYNDGAVGAVHLDAFAEHVGRFHPALWQRYRTGADALGDHFATARTAERDRFRDWRLAWLRK